MQFIDLKTQQKRIKEEIERRIRAVLDHGQYIMGPEIKALEEVLADYTGVKHAIACASGTDALLLALMAYGIKPGDAVFTPPFTFIATAEVINLLGAVPVFVDVDPATFNLDPVQLERAVKALKSGSSGIYPLPDLTAFKTVRPRCIIGVDLFGLPADYDRINQIAEMDNLLVIEDAAQSFGAASGNRKACSLAHIGCTSFFPAKPLGCYGDGGMCFTDDDGLAEMMASIRVHGQGRHKYDHVYVGINGRLDTLQAAILLAKFDIFPEELEHRQLVAGRYTRLLEKAAVPVAPPQIPEGFTSAWAQYSILARSEDERSSFQSRLKDRGIPTAVYYPKPLHLQSAFAFLGYKEGDFPVSEKLSRTIFSLPMHPYLTGEDQEKIVAALA